MPGSAVTPKEKTAAKPRQQTERPRLYKVLLHNDNYTTMEFVVGVLLSVFHKSELQAIQIMLHVHEEGVGVAGVYTAGVAETKVAKVHAMAKHEGFPLRCSMEPE